MQSLITWNGLARHGRHVSPKSRIPEINYSDNNIPPVTTPNVSTTPCVINPQHIPHISEAPQEDAGSTISPHKNPLR
jgi:hypothetical protein